jgi:hypothetical protein
MSYVLNSNKRANFFGLGSQLNPQLGALFQNPMILTEEILNEEIKTAMLLSDQETARYERYIGNLQELKFSLFG